MPGFFVRDRPDRASPRKTKKAGDFPARKPGERSVANVTRRIEFHLLYPWHVTGNQGERGQAASLVQPRTNHVRPRPGETLASAQDPAPGGARDATHAIPL